MTSGRFKPSWWLRGGHGQTLWPVLTRRVPLDVRSERLELPDGDFVQLDWVGDSGPILIVLPGLQGDLKSGYVRGLLRACRENGWRGVLLNYRGRVEPNRLPQSYHCGMTSDIDYLAHYLAQREPSTPIAVAGFSVGANICLKWLGESGQQGRSLPIVAAVGISAPFNLGAVARKIENGLSRIYQWYLLRSLRRDVVRKMQSLGTNFGLTASDLLHLNTFFKFDDRISAPWNGFHGAEDYYAKTRTDVLLKHIAVPTLIVNANNDPLVPKHLIPPPHELSDKVTLEVTHGGGHLGFVSGWQPWSPRFWLDARIPEYLAPFFGALPGR